jgi:hypothetical protein
MRLSRTIAPLLLAAATAIPLLAPTGAAQAAATVRTARSARVVTVSPSQNLAAAMEGLRPGDTLLVAPGTYNQGLVAPAVTPGTASAPIVVRAADTRHPPLLIGGLQLAGADYWQLWFLRVRAAGAAGRSALFMQGGDHWQVRGSEFFGARQTGSYANVVIAGTGGHPQGFVFQDSCVHDAAQTQRVNTDHNMYVDFAGSPETSGLIKGNVIFNHQNGVGIKLGSGGALNQIGPWNVRVVNNTIVNGGRQLLLHGDVRGNYIAGNILGRSSTRFSRSPKTTLTYVHDVTTRGTNTVAWNTGYGASMLFYDPAHALRSAGPNALRADPRFRDPFTCGGWHPTNPTAVTYGRYGTPR